MTTTDGAALLAGILAEPGCDTRRLVYADWLEENGEQERAEFIRLQIEMAKPDASLCPRCNKPWRRIVLSHCCNSHRISFPGNHFPGLPVTILSRRYIRIQIFRYNLLDIFRLTKYLSVSDLVTRSKTNVSGAAIC